MNRFRLEVVGGNLETVQVKNSSGTIVIWEDIDRLDKKLEGAERPGRIVGTITDKLILHIRMTFHRFLDGSLDKSKTISIYFNDEPIKGWDPFCRNETNTIKVDKKDFVLKELSTKEPVLIEPFILPAKEGKYGFSSLKAWKDAKGLLQWNDSQGFYVYRANRLVHYGGWLETRTKDEHLKLVRIAILFNPIHDTSFGTSLDKTRISLPLSLFEYLKNSSDNTKILSKAKAQYNSSKSIEKEEESEEEIELSTTEINTNQATTQPVNSGTITKPDQTMTRPVNSGTITEPDQTMTKPDKTITEFLTKSEEEIRNQQVLERIISSPIQSGIVKDGRLWNLEKNINKTYNIVLNENHVFIKNVYSNNKNSDVIKLFETIIRAIAYTEILFDINGNSTNFDEINKTISKILQDMLDR